MNFLFETITEPLGFFTDPSRRLYWVYLLISLIVFAALVFYRSLWPEIKKQVALHKESLWVDVKLWLFNSLLRTLVTALSLVSLSILILGFVKFMYVLFPSWTPMKVSYIYVAGLLTVVSFLVFDFLRFFQHYLMHKIPFLWAFHQVHHSASYLTPITLYRMHPVENIVSAIRRLGGQTLVFGFFIFMFGSSVNAYDILGVNAISFVANLTLSNLRHSPLPISFGPLEWLFISPAQHQLHHSSTPKLTHSNLGVVLSVWDQVFNTFVLYKGQKIKYGLKAQHLSQQSLYHQLVIPFSLCLQYQKSFATNFINKLKPISKLFTSTGEST